MSEHNPDHVAQVAAGLLAGRFDAEPHQIKQAVDTARLIIDAANEPEDVAAEAPEPETPAAPEPEPEAAPAAE